MKKIIIILLLLFTVSCSKNAITDSKDKNTDLTEVYNGYPINDSETIYYINESKLYSVKNDGSQKTLIFDKEPVSSIQIYDNKIYILCINYVEPRKGEIYTINKDGSDIKLIELGLELSFNYYISHFIINGDFLFFTINDLTNYDEPDFPKDLYKYDLKSSNLSSIYEDLLGNDVPVIYDNIYYYLTYGNTEHNVLYKYNIDTEEKTTIKINKKEHEKRSFISNIKVQDNYVYYRGKTYIDRDKLDGLSDTETIFEDDKFSIISLEITDKYLFFVNKEDNLDDNTSYNTVYRMNLDGSEMIALYSEKMEFTNIPPGKIIVKVYNKNLIYSNGVTNVIIRMDFEGKTLKT